MIRCTAPEFALASALTITLGMTLAVPVSARQPAPDAPAAAPSATEANNPLAKFQAFNVHNYCVPAGAVFNIFIEPQCTVISRGPGQPELQIFIGFNTQFVKK